MKKNQTKSVSQLGKIIRNRNSIFKITFFYSFQLRFRTNANDCIAYRMTSKNIAIYFFIFIPLVFFDDCLNHEYLHVCLQLCFFFVVSETFFTVLLRRLLCFRLYFNCLRIQVVRFNDIYIGRFHKSKIYALAILCF